MICLVCIMIVFSGEMKVFKEILNGILLNVVVWWVGGCIVY